MSLLAWIVLGLIAGFVATNVVNGIGSGVLKDIILGVVGSILGGWLFTHFGSAGITGFNVYSMVVATIGAAALLIVYHTIFIRHD